MSTIVYKKGTFLAGDTIRTYRFDEEIRSTKTLDTKIKKLNRCGEPVEAFVLRNLEKYGNSALPYELFTYLYPSEVMKAIYIASKGRYRVNVRYCGDFWIATIR